VATCPACRRLVPPAGAWEGLGFVTTVGGKEYYQPDFKIFECSNCRLVFRYPTLGEVEFADYYDRVDFRKWELPKNEGKREVFPIDRIVLQSFDELPSAAAILDFGCSTGRLLAPVVEKFKCYGFEINREAAKLAESKGILMIQLDELRGGS
jgi:SAM-dependent methyltransferase